MVLSVISPLMNLLIMWLVFLKMLGIIGGGTATILVSHDHEQV